MPSTPQRIRGLRPGSIISFLAVGVLAVGLMMSASATASSNLHSAAPSHTITITSGPNSTASYPFPDGPAAAVSWTLKVVPDVDPPVTIDSILDDGNGALPSNCYAGGLNGGVGTVFIKASCLQPLVDYYKVKFVIGGHANSINVVNPNAKNAAFVDFGFAATMTADYENFVVRVLNNNGQLVTNYDGTAWVTAFTLDGSRVRLNDTAGSMEPIAIVDGLGSLGVTVMERVEGDTLILQIEAPRLDTARSSIGL